ncbi:hypothetical protein [Helicobacter cetorum]|uniref:Uncharacterized protein n=1 Tax=Helicobacter cetorum (strain ATCC BAA-429 / MIT 00-7128) TaxID=182217 RepID=I0EMU6_HELC0|nr:hypothetical protein [Helicobacter cetorum]AFI04265.1 hypothetical protein HCW_04990 [Helicobacter cetorum MIT 00-7128]
MGKLHFSHIDREQSGDVGFIIKNLIFLVIFALFGWLNTHYFLWPSMMGFKSMLLEENRKKSLLEYTQRHFEADLNSYRTQKETSLLLLKVLGYEESKTILDKISKLCFETYQIQLVSEKQDSLKKASFNINAKTDELKKVYRFFTLLNKYLPSAQSQLPLKISKDSINLAVQFGVSVQYK